MENAERHRFDLMLTDHSWQQYMEGWVSGELARKHAAENARKARGEA